MFSSCVGAPRRGTPAARATGVTGGVLEGRSLHVPMISWPCLHLTATRGTPAARASLLLPLLLFLPSTWPSVLSCGCCCCCYCCYCCCCCCCCSTAAVACCAAAADTIALFVSAALDLASLVSFSCRFFQLIFLLRSGLLHGTHARVGGPGCRFSFRWTLRDGSITKKTGSTFKFLPFLCLRLLPFP